MLSFPIFYDKFQIFIISIYREFSGTFPIPTQKVKGVLS